MNLFAEAEPPSFPGETNDPEVTSLQKQRSSVESMQASIDKQKASVRLQAGEGEPAAAFFTTSWHRSAAPPSDVGLAFPQCDPMSESDLASLVKKTALDEGINPGVIRAVIRRESASYPCAVSSKGATGLMQLMPGTAQQFGVDPLDAKQNIQAGARYLKQLLTRYKGDLKLALAAYNAGPGQVDAAEGIPKIPETKAYVDAILKDIDAAK
jgi:hypothetical protein